MKQIVMILLIVSALIAGEKAGVLEDKRENSANDVKGLNVGHVILIGVKKGSTVFLNGELQSTKREYVVPAGTCEIAVTHPDYQPWHKTVQIDKGDNDTIRVKPKSIYGSLKVISDPPGASVTFRGETKKAPVVFKRLLPTKRDEPIIIKLDTYKTVKLYTFISPNFRAFKRVNMYRSKAYRDSVATAEQQKKSDTK